MAKYKFTEKVQERTKVSNYRASRIHDEEKLRDSAVQSFELELGRFIESHSELIDRIEARNEMRDRLLSELKSKEVSPQILDSARQSMIKQWMQMKDRPSKRVIKLTKHF